MGIISSALGVLRDKVNSVFGATPPANMSLNSSGNHISRPVSTLPSGEIVTYDPIVNSAVSATDNLRNSIQSGESVFKATGNSRFGYVRPVNSGSAFSVSTGFLAPSTIDYLNADLAKHYGMSRETAYAEAMENTAYKRAVADMKASGLNPAVIFGAGRGQTAGTPSYIRSDSSGISFGGSSGYSSAKRSYTGKSSNNGKLFDSGVYSVLSALGGVAGAAVTKNAGGFWVGTSIAQAAMSAANLLNQVRK